MSLPSGYHLKFNEATGAGSNFYGTMASPGTLFPASLTQDRTIEFWARWKTHPGNATAYLFDANVSGANVVRIGIDTSGRPTAVIGNVSGGTTITGSSGLSTDQWHHFALVYDYAAGTAAFYVDGALVGSASVTWNTSAANEVRLSSIPTWYSSAVYETEFEELRVSSSKRYTSAFTVPSSPFSSDSNTLALLHFDNNLTDSAGSHDLSINATYDYEFVDDTDYVPNAPANLAIVGGTPTYNDKPTFTWDFSDNNPADSQSAYQLRIENNVGTEIYNSGKVLSATESHTVTSSLSSGNYTCYVKTWDQADQVSAETSLAFEVVDASTQPGEWAAFDQGDVYLSSVDVTNIHDDNDSTYVTFNKGTGTTTYVQHQFSSTRISGYRLNVGSGSPQDGQIYLEHWDGSQWVRDFTLNVADKRGLGNRLYDLSADVTTTKVRVWVENVSSDVQIVQFNEVPLQVGPSDTTPPSISILSPSDGSTVNGATVKIKVQASDNVGVTQVDVLVDGGQIGSLTSPNVGPDYEFTWDTTDHLNGGAVIEARAYDAAGNMRSASITVTVSNTLASATMFRYWKRQPQTDQTDAWTDKFLGFIGTYHAAPASSDPKKNLRMTAGYIADGAESTDWDDFTPFPWNEKRGIKSATTIQFAVKLIPDYVRTAYGTPTDYQHLLRLIEVPTGAAILAWDPSTTNTSILLFDGSTVTEIDTVAEFSATPLDMAYLDGLYYIAYSDRLAVIDPDNTDDNYEVRLSKYSGHSIASISAGNDGIYIGTDDGGGNGHLLHFIPNAFQKIDTVEGISVVRAGTNDSVVVGTSDGKVYVGSGSLALSYDTQQAAVTALKAASSISFVGTKSAGKLFESQPSWSERLSALFSEIRAIEVYRQHVFAGGNSAKLYRRSADGVWTLFDTLPETDAINDALAWTDSEGNEMLLIATSRSGGARLYRIEYGAADTDAITPVEPPASFAFAITETDVN